MALVVYWYYSCLVSIKKWFDSMLGHHHKEVSKTNTKKAIRINNLDQHDSARCHRFPKVGRFPPAGLL